MRRTVPQARPVRRGGVCRLGSQDGETASCHHGRLGAVWQWIKLISNDCHCVTGRSGPAGSGSCSTRRRPSRWRLGADDDIRGAFCTRQPASADRSVLGRWVSTRAALPSPTDGPAELSCPAARPAGRAVELRSAHFSVTIVTRGSYLRYHEDITRRISGNLVITSVNQ